MALDWLNAPIEKSFGDLIARRRYTKAIEVLRAQILGRTPTTQERLQLADLLLLAGRRAEGVPILLGLADEFAADGFAAKAVAVLKRIDKIEPGRPDVESRLASLVQPQRPPAASPGGLPELGIEEIGSPGEAEGPVPEDLAGEPPAGEPPAEPEAVPPAEGSPPAEAEMNPAVRGAFRRFLESLPESPPEGSAPAGVEPGEPPEVTTPAPAETASPAEAAVPAETAGPAEAEEQPEPARAEAEAVPGSATAEAAAEEEGGVKRRIRGVWRFLTSIAGSEEEAKAAPPPEVAPGAPQAEVAAPEPQAEVAAPEPAPETGVAASPAEEARETEAEFELDAEVEAPEAPAEPAAAAAPESPAEREKPPEPPPPVEAQAETEAPTVVDIAEAPSEVEPESLSEDEFQEQVLDMIQGALQKPAHPPPPPAAPPPPPDDVGARTLPAQPRPMLAMAGPLFETLSQDEMLAVLRGLKLHTFEAGDVIVTEGEPGASLFILSTGAVRVFVRNPAGRDLEVGLLREGDFFGEISSLSGRPRTATITAASACELLELERATVDSIARTHPRVRERLEAFYIARASSPEAAAIRAVPLGDARTRQHALEVLEAHFGESRWDPRMRLRLADLLLKAGKDEDAVPVLIGLADDLARQGYTEKAVAILKQIERIRKRHLEEINLAPLAKDASGAAPPAPPAETAAAAPREEPAPSGAPRLPWKGTTRDAFRGWIVDVLRDRVARRGPLAERPSAPPADAARVSGYARGLRASPLFEGLGEEELLDVIRGLRLLTPQPGEVLVTEGEPGESLFVLASGAVRVFVRDSQGHNVALALLREGSFFGEISTLSSRPRTATVTAAAPCELLELDKAAVEAISSRHPRVRSVLEEFYIDRASSPEAARIRAGGRPEAG